MANRIAVRADTIATITNTSANNANRIADFIFRLFARPSGSKEIRVTNFFQQNYSPRPFGNRALHPLDKSGP
jgi:hypothetical protein